MSILQDLIGHRFADQDLLLRALTHRSWANETRGECHDNQRLEFLGDAVVGLVITEVLFSRFPQQQEGTLSRLKAHLVCEATLAEIAIELDLGEYMRLGRGEENSGGREKTSMLADCYEALVAAVHLDAGFDAAREFVIDHHENALTGIDAPTIHIDGKSQLQERLQRDFGRRPSYRITGVTGPDHDRRFTAEVRLDDTPLGTGRGRSKKEAQQHAASDALERMNREDSHLD